jgi:hypothetical protein
VGNAKQPELERENKEKLTQFSFFWDEHMIFSCEGLQLPRAAILESDYYLH